QPGSAGILPALPGLGRAKKAGRMPALPGLGRAKKAGRMPALPGLGRAKKAGRMPALPGLRSMRLWYRHPAAVWNEALPIGNGRLGAMVFGGIQTERIQLNEDTIWAGEKRDRLNPEAAANLAEVRRLLCAGKPREAEILAEKTIISIPKRMPPYQPLGDLLISFRGQTETRDYYRELDLDTGIARVSYQSGDAKFTREVISS